MLDTTFGGAGECSPPNGPAGALPVGRSRGAAHTPSPPRVPSPCPPCSVCAAGAHRPPGRRRRTVQSEQRGGAGARKLRSPMEHERGGERRCWVLPSWSCILACTEGRRPRRTLLLQQMPSVLPSLPPADCRLGPRSAMRRGGSGSWCRFKPPSTAMPATDGAGPDGCGPACTEARQRRPGPASLSWPAAPREPCDVTSAAWQQPAQPPAAAGAVDGAAPAWPPPAVA